MEKKISLIENISGLTYISEDKRVFDNETACKIWEEKIELVNKMFPNSKNPQILMDINAYVPDKLPYMLVDVIDGVDCTLKNIVLFSFKENILQKEFVEAIGLCDEADVYFGFNKSRYNHETWYKTLIPNSRYILIEYLDKSCNVYQICGTVEEFKIACLKIINDTILCWNNQ